MQAQLADQDQVSQLFETYFSYVWKSLLRLGVNAHDAEDLAQDVFVIVHRRIDSYDRSRPIRPWLFGIAHNVLRDWRRLARHKDTHLAHERGQDDPALAQYEAAQLLHAGLRSVEEDLRGIVILADLDGVPMEEISRTFELSTSATYARLQRGRQQLRIAVTRLQAERGRRG